jgi:type II secretory pathway pseudopilin PulG
LTELVVVIAVLGVLATAVVLVVRGVRDEAVDSTCAIEQRTIERGVDTWTELHDDGQPVTIQKLAEVVSIRDDSHHFTIKPNGNVVPRPDSECAGMVGPASAAQAAAGGGAAPGFSAADLKVTLSWTGNVDADIWVQSPSGELLGWVTPLTPGLRREPDVVPPTPIDRGPHVEGITWDSGYAPVGTYQAWVRFENNGWGPQDAESYTLRIISGATELAMTTGAIGAQDSVSVPVTALLSA